MNKLFDALWGWATSSGGINALVTIVGTATTTLVITQCVPELRERWREKRIQKLDRRQVCSEWSQALEAYSRLCAVRVIDIGNGEDEACAMQDVGRLGDLSVPQWIGPQAGDSFRTLEPQIEQKLRRFPAMVIARNESISLLTRSMWTDSFRLATLVKKESCAVGLHAHYLAASLRRWGSLPVATSPVDGWDHIATLRKTIISLDEMERRQSVPVPPAPVQQTPEIAT